MARCEQAESALYGPDEAPWLNRLAAEHGNLRAALGWALERDPEAALRLAAAVWRFWWFRGHLTEGGVWLERVLGPGRGPPTAARVRALTGAAAIAASCGDAARDAALSGESLALARELGDGLGEVQALHGLGTAALDQGEPARAASLLAEAEGDAARAARRLGEALPLFLQVGHKEHTALALLLFCSVAAGERPAAMARLLGATEAAWADLGYVPPPLEQPRLERTVERLREALGTPALETTRTAGQALSLEEAVAEALALADELAADAAPG